MNSRPKRESPRFTVIVNPAWAEKKRREAQRQAEIKKFIAACEALYRKNTGGRGQ